MALMRDSISVGSTVSDFITLFLSILSEELITHPDPFRGPKFFRFRKTVACIASIYLLSKCCEHLSFLADVRSHLPSKIAIHCVSLVNDGLKMELDLSHHISEYGRLKDDKTSEEYSVMSSICASFFK